MAGSKPMTAPVTRDDVARLAGVSSATVSRVYNRPSAVLDKKREAVFRAAKQLGYTPDLNASGLRRKGSGSVLLVLRPPSRDVYRWFYGEALIHAQAALAGTCYKLLFNIWDGREPFARFLAHNKCDGVVMGLGTFDESVVKALESAGLPYMLCSQTELSSVSRLCYIDENAGGAVAAKALLKAGCRRPAHITAMLEKNSVCAARWEGFRSVLRKAKCEPVLITAPELGVRGGREAVRRLVPLVKRGEVDGLFVVNDLTAVGVMQNLVKSGIAIPEELALVAYDNLPFRETVPVEMASVDVSIGKLYQTAVEMLAEELRGERKPGEPIRKRIVPTFVRGASLPEK
ncbi:MAG: HTH-type transcriptional regulator DegA [Lentisphaerae bacterium ADurb.Bin242]|nr:MAG: HTH-type transcriptional regulator DegA [Lentisphaerae bacterium ADurb.Bin242]